MTAVYIRFSAIGAGKTNAMRWSETPFDGGARYVLATPATNAAEDLLTALNGVMSLLGSAESNASGSPDWPHVGPRVTACRAAVAKATEA